MGFRILDIWDSGKGLNLMAESRFALLNLSILNYENWDNNYLTC